MRLEDDFSSRLGHVGVGFYVKLMHQHDQKNTGTKIVQQTTIPLVKFVRI
jgi:hypothetical protein